jgi:hypothetical protein
VLESCNLVLLAGPSHYPSYATMGVVCPLERGPGLPITPKVGEGVFSEVRLPHARGRLGFRLGSRASQDA